MIVAKNLTKKYRDFTAVDGISFEIREGECFGFLGPNGAGKTTTIRMILCDRLVIMHQGRILKEGSPRKLILDEIGTEVVEIRIVKEEDEKLIAQMADVSCGHERVGDTLYFYCRDGHDVMKKIVQLNLPNVLNRPASLEDVFLKLTGRSSEPSSR